MAKVILEIDTNENMEDVVTALRGLMTVETKAQMEERIGRQFHEKIEDLKAQIEQMDNPKVVLEKRGRLHGRWSRKYDQCLSCHQADTPHMSKGLCRRCYQIQLLRKKQKTIVKLDVPGQHLHLVGKEEHVR